ncbi:MAG: hypothetical protein ABIK92_13070 [Pseudomonadota bacterium]
MSNTIFYTSEQLTQEAVLDLENYNKRIADARAKLSELPSGYLDYKEFKKREKLKHDYQEEINHVNFLISLANTALNSLPV